MLSMLMISAYLSTRTICHERHGGVNVLVDKRGSVHQPMRVKSVLAKLSTVKRGTRSERSLCLENAEDSPP
jgi:hypothetical protein